MTRADTSILRLGIGLGLAVLIAYGFALPAPFVVCVMTVLMLCKPGPPIPPAKGVVLAIVVGVLLGAGLLLVPVLEHYAVAGVSIVGVLLYAVFFAGARKASPLTIILVIAFTVIPVAGVAEQALASALSVAFATGLGIGIFVSALSHALFPSPAGASAGPTAAALVPESADDARWDALRATLVVLPVFVLALTHPALYLPAILKTVALGQQSGVTNARTAGRELVGSTLMSAAMAVVVWTGLTLRPNLWMLMLWCVAAALWAGARLYGVKASSFAPTFWSNALVTMLLLLGPAIEDSANGKDVYSASAVRVALFIAVALYAWATVWLLERWRAARFEPLLPRRA